jgi:hypothetical protein
MASWLSRGHVRLVALACNVAMLLYVYIAYLMNLEWGGINLLESSQMPSQRLMSHFLKGEHDVAFDKLRAFTFSEAMLHNLDIFLLVGSFVGVTLFCLERERVWWLQEHLSENLPSSEATRARWWLEAYFWLLSLMFVFILLLVPFHIELPLAHYFVAANALGLGFLSMCTYLFLPLDFKALAKVEDTALAAWAVNMSDVVKPTIKFGIGLHVATLVAALLKSEAIDHHGAALLFGVLETATVLSYQVFQVAFMTDDIIVRDDINARPRCTVSLSSKYLWLQSQLHF